MLTRFSQLWRRHPILLAGFALAMVATLFFAVRFTTATIYWADPAHRDQPIEGWMTPRYVVKSWDVPPSVVIDALELRPPMGRQTLDRLARNRGTGSGALIESLQTAIAAHRAEQ